jgi:hypothetical protein
MEIILSVIGGTVVTTAAVVALGLLVLEMLDEFYLWKDRRNGR